jgi:hypothetical protein
MKHQTMINMIAGAGLVLGSFSAMAEPGWAFNNPNVPVVEQGAGSGEKHAHKKKDRSGGPGWAFNNPNVPEVKKSAASGEKHRPGGPGWAFDHPHEPVQGSSGRS